MCLDVQILLVTMCNNVLHIDLLLFSQVVSCSVFLLLYTCRNKDYLLAFNSFCIIYVFSASLCVFMLPDVYSTVSQWNNVLSEYESNNICSIEAVNKAPNESHYNEAVNYEPQ